ncbi:hypothetical protein C8F01DRAFT_1125887 [Mycena amicta]|nr:hypothetical protein C8F01DRAFT_1125887 [Mycena amicta]
MPPASPTRSRPSTYLHRACSNCRHRKTGCDGERPVCRRCREHPRRNLAPCVYTYTPPGGRVQLPDLPADQDHGFRLIDPYRDFLVPSPLSPSDSSVTWTPSPTQEGTSELSAMLLETFLSYFGKSHFFYLDQDQLQSLPDPGSFSNAVALWATHIARGQSYLADSGYSEDDLLLRTVSAVARDTMTIDSDVSLTAHRQDYLQLIQTEILLSLYYLDCAKFQQGRYHCAAATSLAMGCGLHQLGSNSPVHPGPFPPAFLGDALPVRAQDPTREKINAFWAVVILNNYWVALCGSPSNIPSDTMITTRWPTAIPTDSDLHQPPSTNANDVAGHSPFTLLAKASILLERTISLTNAVHYPGNAPNAADLWALDRRLETFRELLSQFFGGPTTATPQGLGINPQLVLTHLFVNTAVLQLHATYATSSPISYRKCVTAAGYVTAWVARDGVGNEGPPDPMFGPFLSAFAEMYISYLPAGSPNANLKAIVAALRSCAVRSSPTSILIDKCLKATDERLHLAQFALGIDTEAQSGTGSESASESASGMVFAHPSP